MMWKYKTMELVVILGLLLN